MPRSSPIARFSGLVMAGLGLAHFTSPQLFESITRPAFPRQTTKHIYINGGIETVIGLGLSARQTRSLAVVGSIGYLAYLVGNALRNR
jgi:uncharacterized membrane protein